MSKSILDYLPKKRPTALVQTKCDEQLVQMAKGKMEEDEYTWRHIIEAGFINYLESKGVKVPDEIRHAAKGR